MEHNNQLINYSDFAKIEIRVGTIISAEIFKEAKKPAYKREFGIKKAQKKL